MPTAPLAPADPTTVGGYTLLGRLGAGGMGTVYLARASGDEHGEKVALKVLHEHLARNPEFLARFAAEAAAAHRVAGFCTAKVLHADVQAHPPYLVTEYVAGPSLDEVLADGPLPASELEALAVGVAAALTAIHAAGLAHRDLKPSNVLLSRYGPKVIDFGVARALSATVGHTQPGMLFGTPGWLAPEQLYGTSTAASDVFVWGLLIARAGAAWRPAPELRVTVPSTEDLRALPPAVAGAVTAALNPDARSRPTAEALLLRLCGSAEAGPVRTATAVLSRPWSAPYPTAAPGQAAPPHPLPAPARPPRANQQQRARRPYQPWPYPPATRHPQGHQQGRPQAHQHGHQPSRPPGRLQSGPPSHPQWPPRPPAPLAARKRRRWYTRKRLLLPVALVAALLLLPQDNPEPKVNLPANTARDGLLEFTVNRWECGKASVGTPPIARQAQGQLCTVELKVRNFGDQARRVHVGSQKLHDTAGRTFNADGGAWFYLDQAQPFFRHEINPGNEITGALVFDIAKDAVPQRIQVHDSPFSGGASITLSP